MAIVLTMPASGAIYIDATKLTLKNKYDFAQLCFQCDEWITDEVLWYNHC